MKGLMGGSCAPEVSEAVRSTVYVERLKTGASQVASNHGVQARVDLVRVWSRAPAPAPAPATAELR